VVTNDAVPVSPIPSTAQSECFRCKPSLFRHEFSVGVSDTLETLLSLATRCLDSAREALDAACHTDGP